MDDEVGPELDELRILTGVSIFVSLAKVAEAGGVGLSWWLCWISRDFVYHCVICVIQPGGVVDSSLLSRTCSASPL